MSLVLTRCVCTLCAPGTPRTRVTMHTRLCLFRLPPCHLSEILEHCSLHLFDFPPRMNLSVVLIWHSSSGTRHTRGHAHHWSCVAASRENLDILFRLDAFSIDGNDAVPNLEKGICCRRRASLLHEIDVHCAIWLFLDTHT